MSNVPDDFYEWDEYEIRAGAEFGALASRMLDDGFPPQSVGRAMAGTIVESVIFREMECGDGLWSIAFLRQLNEIVTGLLEESTAVECQAAAMASEICAGGKYR